MTVTIKPPQQRLRRLRNHPSFRDMVQEHRVSISDLVLPVFVKAGITEPQSITAMPGHAQWPIEKLDQEITEIVELGIPAVMLFGIPAYKDSCGSAALLQDGVVQQAVRRIKQLAPDLFVITDLCFCEYTDHGHCGLLASEKPGDVDNDATLPLLAQQAISHAEAGADMIAPSGMMDGMVAAIRSGIDHANFSHLPIMSYAVKYASSLYEPFREAAEGTPQQGDRRGYQMNPANASIGIREAQQDVAEGADCLMVKPGGLYLDMVQRLKQRFTGVPLAVYQVSGEFAMIKAAAEQGCVNEFAMMQESLVSMKRAGADMIITYFAKSMARFLRQS